jgi:hypothetical protein
MSRTTTQFDYPDLKNGVHTTIVSSSKRIRLSTYDKGGSILIYIGGHTKYCIYAEVKKLSNAKFQEEGYLHKIRFDELCSLDNKFIRGADTQFILKFLLTYIIKTYPGVKKLAFNDASSRICNNGAHINLAFMQFIFTGKTWYQKHYAAYLEGRELESFTIYYKEYTQRKKTTDWDTLTNTIYNFSTINIPIETLQKVYNNTTTWEAFFGYIEKEIEIGDFCVFVYPWLDTFMNKFFKHNIIGFQYMMPIKEYDINYELQPYQSGGKRFTRKRRYIESRDER